jgi:hypothetical protein
MAKGGSSGLGQQIDVRIAAAVIALAIAVFGGLYYMLTRPEESIIIPPTPEEATVMVLSASIERVVETISTTGKAPKTMGELAPLPNGTTPTADGWNNEIILKVNGGGSRYIVEVRSKGPDGVASNGDDIVVEGVIQKDPNSSRFFVSAQSQQGGTPPTPVEPESAG